MAMLSTLVLPVNASRRLCWYHAAALGPRGCGTRSIAKSQSIFPSSHFGRRSRLGWILRKGALDHGFSLFTTNAKSAYHAPRHDIFRFSRHLTAFLAAEESCRWSA